MFQPFWAVGLHGIKPKGLVIYSVLIFPGASVGCLVSRAVRGKMRRETRRRRKDKLVSTHFPAEIDRYRCMFVRGWWATMLP